MSTKVERNKNGITAIEVDVRPSREFQSAGVAIRYEFGAPVGEADVLEPEHEIGELATELANRRVDQLVAEKEAKTQGEVERQQKKRPPATGPRFRRPPYPPTDVEPDIPEPEVAWSQAAYPNKRGTVRYRPTDNLSTDGLKAMIIEAIKEVGADSDLHVVYDERIGDRGLEKTGKGYRFASVKPTEDNPAYYFMLTTAKSGKKYPKQSFYVDFNEDGTVRVKATDDYKEAAAAAQQEPEPGNDDEPEELPF